MSKREKDDNTETILIMDDEPVVLTILTSLLEGEGYTVIAAPNGEKVLDAVDKCDVDLFLTDMMIPRRHGIAISWELRQRGHEFPIVIFSAFLDHWDKEVFKDCGINEWIAKPVKPKKLLETVRRCLDER